MGISLSYRRISQGRFNYLQVAQDEDLIDGCMYENEQNFSDSPPQTENSEYLDLEKLYPLVSGFLNPGYDSTSIFYLVTHRGKSVIADPTYEADDYLGVVYYLTPSEVRVITQAMNDIPEDEWEERYRRLMNDATIEESRARSEFPTYDNVIDIFTDVRQFFQQAADNDEVILRWYN